MSAESPQNKSELDLRIETITDPTEAFEILTTSESESETLSPAQIEKLKDIAKSEEEVLFNGYKNYVESGVILEPTDFEREIIMWIAKILIQTQEQEIATYLLKHSASLTTSDRERLEKIV